MSETFETPDETVTIDDRVSGDGKGTARTVSYVAKPGSHRSNRDDLETKARAALAINATYLALANPNNAQTLAQVQRLTRECSALIRLLLGELNDTAGT